MLLSLFERKPARQAPTLLMIRWLTVPIESDNAVALLCSPASNAHKAPSVHSNTIEPYSLPAASE